jgi:hypothetical protein
MGRFNKFLKSVVLCISEARDLGEFDRYTFYDHTKSYIAAPPDALYVDEKNLGEYYVPNLCGVIITTNHKTNGIYLPPDDRRHYVAWSECAKEEFDQAYWDALWRFYDDDGRRHVGAYLAQLDLSDWNAKAGPKKTDAFWAIVDAGRAPEDSELAQVIEMLENPDAVMLSDIVNEANNRPELMDFGTWLMDRKNRRLVPHRMEACGYQALRNDAAADGKWRISGRHETLYAKRELPMRDRLEAARALVARRREPESPKGPETALRLFSPTGAPEPPPPGGRA